jgi:hypothetical protein
MMKTWQRLALANLYKNLLFMINAAKTCNYSRFVYTGKFINMEIVV